MAARSCSSSQIPDITTCSICLATFKEPKVLPCIHTFCLQCLDKYCANKKQEVSCPLCRKIFFVPSGGIQDLPNNFFMNQLLNVNKSCQNNEAQDSVNHMSCELCSDSDSEMPATSHCVDCDQHICDRCSVAHGNLKLTKSHRVVRVRDVDLESSQKRIKLGVNYCEEHPCEQNKLYCYDCKVIMCHKCLSKHRQHYCSDVDEAGEKFRDQLNNDINILEASVLKWQTNLEQLEFKTETHFKKVASIEREITQKCDKLVSLIQSKKYQLIKELDKFKDKMLKKVETAKDEIERQLVITESFKRYCQEMMNKGTAYDISRTAHDLHARAEELVKTRDEPDCHIMSDVEITFKPSSLRTNSVKNYIGELVIQDIDEADTRNEDKNEVIKKVDFTTFLTQSTLLHVMPLLNDDERISGITVVGSELFIVRCTPQIDVYMSHNMTLTRQFVIIGSKYLNDLISCSHYNCLYALDSTHRIIYRYDLTEKKTSSWLVKGTCFRLSGTSDYNVLATLPDSRVIQEYTTRGSLIREISIDKIIDQPVHCVPLSTDNMVICNLGVEHKVNIVDSSGSICYSYGGSSGSGVGRMNGPYHLSVDARDNVLFADDGNNRVQLLSPSLTYLGDIVIPGHQLDDPYIIYFDELKHRLYIAEWNGGRLIVLGVGI